MDLALERSINVEKFHESPLFWSSHSTITRVGSLAFNVFKKIALGGFIFHFLMNLNSLSLTVESLDLENLSSFRAISTTAAACGIGSFVLNGRNLPLQRLTSSDYPCKGVIKEFLKSQSVMLTLEHGYGIVDQDRVGPIPLKGEFEAIFSAICQEPAFIERLKRFTMRWDIRVVSKDIEKLENLEFLDIRSSKIDNFPSLGNCEKLEKLTLAIEDLTFDESFLPPPNVQSLTFENCQFESGPKFFNECKELKDLTFENCKQLRTCPDIRELQKLEKISFIGCSNLLLSTLPIRPDLDITIREC